MNYLNKIIKMTKGSIPLRVKKEINNVKIGIENAASCGEYEYRRLLSFLTYPDEIIEYFKKEGFQVDVEEVVIEYLDRSLVEKNLVISWKEQSNDEK